MLSLLSGEELVLSSPPAPLLEPGSNIRAVEFPRLDIILRSIIMVNKKVNGQPKVKGSPSSFPPSCPSTYTFNHSRTQASSSQDYRMRSRPYVGFTSCLLSAALPVYLWACRVLVLL